jgi:type IV pilus assembly protein PilM
MAGSGGIWGIDIGQCALKALRCTVGPGDVVVADAFDYIEYPKILNQPEADPKAMVQEALTQFLSRNKVKGDKLAMCVSGQSGLARFFKPPPVDAKKLPELVKYEARNQIPFALEDVIWDWQMMGGGTEVDGFTLDAEIGLFAMKRDAVFRALEPYDQAEIEVDIVQLSPEAIFNFVGYDVIQDAGVGEDYDADNPPPSLAVLSMGTDTSDLVVTNGFRLWQRSIPIGGNHFTKQLSKELKLTFAKAEHLKRNARQAEDPKAVFQAMRSVFNDMVTEVQRSLAFFQSVDRKAKIKGLVLLGNAVKLPGLSQYLAKNLGLEIANFEGFNRLTGAGVVASPSFKDNVLSFGVCYGLCLQGMGLGKLRTNLVPRELVTERLIRAKKPWALASYAGLLLACSFNFFFHYNAWSKVYPERWNARLQEVDSLQAESTRFQNEFKERKDELTKVINIGEELVGNVDRRLLWLEMLKAISQALPTTDFTVLNGKPTDYVPGTIPDHKEYPIDQRKEIYVEYIESEYFPDLTTWIKDPAVLAKYAEERRIAEENAPAAPAAEDAAAPPADGQTPPVDAAPPVAPAPGAADDAFAADINTILAEDNPDKSGWVIEIRGHHFYNKSRGTAGVTHLRNTLIKELEEGSVMLPVAFSSGEEAGSVKLDRFTMKELGIGFVILATDEEIDPYFKIPNVDYIDPATLSAGDAFGAAPNRQPENLPVDPNNPPQWTVPKYSFTIQFAWKPKHLRARLQERERKLLEEEARAKAAAEAANTPTLPTTGT